MARDKYILIDISGSDPARDVGAAAFLHAEARDRVLRTLSEPAAVLEPAQVGYERPIELNVRDDRRHEAILVSARRGEGKTTFLTTILRALEGGSGLSFPPHHYDRRLYSLGIIDPTLIESKQNIIIVVIDLIRIAAEHHRKLMGHGAEEFEVVQRALRKLAQGLTVLDGIGDPIYAGRDWVDADYVLDKGLENASAAHSFERSLRDYVGTVAHYINVNAFVLAIDDVDTWFESGWPVLEAIRKYLVTPQLRIILSGDLNLYSLLVRRQQWSQMTEPFLQAEARREIAEPGSSRMREIGRLVDALQDQYLIKVAPPENRVELRSLEYHAERSSIMLVGAGLEEPTHERTFLYWVSVRLLGLRSENDIELVRQQILRLPLRSALQILRGVASFATPFDVVDALPRSDAIDTLRHVAWTSLMSVGVDVGESRDADAATVIEAIADWLTRSRLWLPMSRFLPDGSDEHQNMAAIYFGAVLMNTFHRRPGRMVDYWLKLSVIREKIDGGSVDHPRDGDAPGGVARLVRHLNIRSIESAIQTVSRLAAWDSVEGRGSGSPSAGMRFSGVSVPLERIRSDRTTMRALYGDDFINADGSVRVRYFQELEEADLDARTDALANIPTPLRGYHSRLISAGWSYGNRFSGIFANGVEELSERLDRRAATVLLLARSRIVSRQRYESGNYSFLRLIAVVGELINAGSATDERTLRTRISRILVVATQARSYPTPSAEGSADTGQPRSDFNNESDLYDAEAAQLDPGDWSDGSIDLEEVIYKWLSFHADKTPAVAPVTLSRMWTRFTYASTNVRSALRSGETRYLGILFHRTLVTFLHAVGIEALRATDFQPPVGAASNPVRSSRVFSNLLHTIYGESEYAGFLETPEHALFDLLFTCPLWGFFFNHPNVGSSERRGKDDVYSDFMLLRMYYQRTRRILQTDGPFNQEVILRSPRRGEEPAKFSGLHSLLNSIPIQGDGDQGPRTSGNQSRGTTTRGSKGESSDAARTDIRRGREPLA